LKRPRALERLSQRWWRRYSASLHPPPWINSLFLDNIFGLTGYDSFCSIYV
jgi:hypothetical protein